MKKGFFVICFIILICSSYSFSQTWQELDSIRKVYMEHQSYDTALVYAEKGLQSVKEKTGENDTLYANMLTAIFEVNFYSGKYAKAIEYCEKEKEIRKALQGDKHPDYATTLNNLAVSYNKIGDFPAAELLCLEVINLYKKVYGEKHPKYAVSLNNLAGLYYDICNYSAAEPLFLEAITILKEELGDKHPNYATSINNVAFLYKTMGNYSAAEPLFLDALNIRKEVLGKKHPDYARSLNNLASLYQAMGNSLSIKEEMAAKFAMAETLYLEAKSLRKEVLGEKHLDYATSLNNIAGLYRDMGKYIDAEPLYFEAKNIWKETLGEKHPFYATALNNLALLYYSMGKFALAEPLAFEAKNIRKIILGEHHPQYATSLNSLAAIYTAMDNYSFAEPLYFECLEVINSAINQNFAYLSEKEKEMYFKTHEKKIEDFYSFSLKRKIENNEITKTVFNTVVKNKGFLLKSSTAMRLTILNSNDTVLKLKYEKWINLKKVISNLYSTEISKRKQNPEELEQQANIIEKDLVQSSQVFNDFKKAHNINWESIKNSLMPNEAAIEFLRFTEGKKSDTTIYCALIITPQCKQPEMIKLFEEKQILKIIYSASGNNLNQVNNIYGTNEKTKEMLYKLIWQPIEKHIEGINTIYYSPDGILHKISFAAMGKSKNMYLCDNINLQQVSSTGKVAIPENAFINNNITACIIGGVDYTSDTSKNSLWQYLPGTLSEANAINTRFSKKDIKITNFTGKEATELSFKNIYSTKGSNPEILHIATHGFFYPDPEQIKEEKTNEQVETGIVAFRGSNSGFGLWQFVKNKNPLMRSGVVLAGANKVWSEPYAGTDNEGVLTAQEVSQLDMKNTKLVVLSACETGLGDIKGSEGVYGLQRAFKMAGVKFIIMSLWQVPDKETVEFMEMFYTKLLKIKDIRKAFNETQKEMRRKYDPYYWAAFILIE